MRKFAYYNKIMFVCNDMCKNKFLNDDEMSEKYYREEKCICIKFV